MQVGRRSSKRCVGHGALFVVALLYGAACDGVVAQDRAMSARSGRDPGKTFQKDSSIGAAGSALLSEGLAGDEIGNSGRKLRREMTGQ